MPLLYPREMLAQVMEESGREFVVSARDTLFALVDTVFFASMMIEEGEPVRVAVVHEEGGAAELAKIRDTSPETAQDAGNPDLAWDVTEISQRPFEPATIAKLSPGLKYGTHLIVVGGRSPHLWIDGIARRTPRTDGGAVTRIAAPRPGVVVFEQGYSELLRFDAGRRVPPSINVFTDECRVRATIASITGSRGSERGYSAHEWAILGLLRRMRAVGHGAILALSPHEPDAPTIERVRYRRTDANILSNRIRAEWTALSASIGSAMPSEGKVDVEDALNAAEKQAEYERAREATEAAVDDIAQQSAIDGAILAGPELAVYGAGYLIPSDPSVLAHKALDPAMSTTEPLPARHGARHQAAFSFAHQNPGGVAFVVSEDGPVSCVMKVEDRVVVWPVRILET